VLKINLLPPYILEKRKVRRAALLFGILFVALIAGMLAWWAKLGSQERDLQTRLADMQQKAAMVTAKQAMVAAEKAKSPIIQNKVKFIEDVMAYNLKAPKLYEELAKYTYSRILYASVQPSGNQITIQAHARSVGDCGRYLLNMYRASHIFSSVGISAVPGWSSDGSVSTGAAAAQAGPMMSGAPMPGMTGMLGAPGAQPAGGGSSISTKGFDFSVVCTLVEPISAPAYGNTGAEASPGMAPGSMGVPGGAPGPGMSPSGGPMRVGGMGR
jgi:hypothetical protein